VIGGIGIVLTLFLIYVLRSLFSRDIEFFTTGKDSGFSISEILLLRKLSGTSRLEHPASLFWSVSALSRSIKKAIDNAQQSGTVNSAGFQQFLAKLYAYRAKIELENSRKKTIVSTKKLGQGQRIRILVHGEGAFSSHLISNGRELAVAYPKQQGRLSPRSFRWNGTRVSIYLWRKDDASYTFDTVVLKESFFREFPVLHLAHTDNAHRAQKRKSARAAAKLYGEIFLFTGTFAGGGGREFESEGFKCFLEDISAGGALVRVGGRGIKGMQFILKFQLGGRQIAMEGIVRGVEYNTAAGQSRLHFECEKIDTESKNVILGYVYNALPQEGRGALNAAELAKSGAPAGSDSEEKPDETEEGPQQPG
jgi:c-di-GMP-binding flagellar brake protein YcgR